MLHKKQYNNKPKPLHTFIKVKNNDGNNNKSLSLRDKGTYFYKQWFSGKDSKNTLTTNKLSYSIPVICGMAFLVGIGLVINPISSSQNNASAVGSDADGDYGIETYATNGSMAITMNDNYYPDDKSDSSTNVIEAGTTAYRRYGFTVSSQSSNGYRLYVQAAPGYTGELRGLAHPRETISGVSGETSGSTMPANTWGYTLIKNVTNPNTVDAGSQSYKAVPENGSIITPSFYSGPTETTNGTDFSLIFGANFGSDKPADHYQTKVLLSLAAGATEIASLSTITYMQDMSSTICQNTPIEPALGSTKQLIDKRDQKKYWVTRLQDGNCWMVQNLDYDLGSSLSAETSDVESDANLTIVAYNVNGVTEWKTANTSLLQYYDPGLYVSTTPTEMNSCGGVESLSVCADYGWKVYQGGNPEEEHYLVGNYYSWKAATADTPIIDNNATGSVCPYGWKLPFNGQSTTNGSFGFLLTKYGFADSDGTSLTNSIGQNIASKPLYFVRGGSIGNKVYTVGLTGRYWSSTALDTSNSYYMLLGTNNFDYSASSRNDFGFNIRCVVR